MPDPFRFPGDYADSPGALLGTKTLDGRVYRFRWLPNVRVNEGRGGYFVDLFNVLGQAVVRGVKVVVTDDLWGRFRSTVVDVPPGRVVVRRTDGLDEDPAIYDLTDPMNPQRLKTLGSPNVVIEYVSVDEDAS